MKFRPTLLAFGLGAIAIATSMGAHAEGNVENGKKLAYTCHGCHGVPNYKNAFPSYRVPKLGNQNAKYIEAALKELEDALKNSSSDKATIEAKVEALAQASQKLGEKMYADMQAQQGAAGAAAGAAGAEAASAGASQQHDDVVDADFKEVKKD